MMDEGGLIELNVKLNAFKKIILFNFCVAPNPEFCYKFVHVVLRDVFEKMMSRNNMST